MVLHEALLEVGPGPWKMNVTAKIGGGFKNKEAQGWRERKPDVVKSVNAWAETPVQGKDLVVDKGGEGEVVEQVRERFPHICVPVLA